jgi:hypothetical protein
MALVSGQQSASRVTHSGEKRNHCLYRILKPRLYPVSSQRTGWVIPVDVAVFEVDVQML